VKPRACSRGADTCGRRPRIDDARRPSRPAIPHVALVEAGLVGDSERWWPDPSSHRLEEADPPAELQHERNGGALEVANHELVNALASLVELRSARRSLYRPRLTPPVAAVQGS